MSVRDWASEPEVMSSGNVYIYIPPGDRNDAGEPKIVPIGSEEDAVSVQWLSEEQSLFKVPTLDCRRVTRFSISATSEPATIELFSELRVDLDGEYVREQHPKEAYRISYELSYNCKPIFTQGRLFTASRLEYLWDVACHKNELIFSKSWTGEVWYRAKFNPELERLGITEIEAPSNETESYWTDSFHILSVDFLIRTYILHEIAPHPIPDPFIDIEPKTLAWHSKNEFGCDARFGIPAKDLWALRCKEWQSSESL